MTFKSMDTLQGFQDEMDEWLIDHWHLISDAFIAHWGARARMKKEQALGNIVPAFEDEDMANVDDDQEDNDQEDNDQEDNLNDQEDNDQLRSASVPMAKKAKNAVSKGGGGNGT